MKRAVTAAAFLALFAGTGCSVSDFSFEKIGNSVLDMVGIGAAQKAFDMSDSLLKATETLSNEEEYYLGRAVAARILAQFPELRDDALSSYLNLVGRTVASFSDRPNTHGGYHFVVLDTEDINALAAPGGFIFISKGFLKTLPNEDALAAVLAHEVTHVAERHGLEAISQQHLSDALSALGQLAGSLNCGQVLQQATLVFGSAVDDVVSTLVEKGYSREQEFEADLGSRTILSRAGYGPGSMTAVLDELDRAGNGEDGGWFSTHPSTDDRREALAADPATGAPTSSDGAARRLSRFESAVSRIRS